MKINVLDSSVFNRISAGEIIERPSSVLKELIENSIDAGASCIEVEVEEYGVKKIKITDNGVGIEKSQVKTAFLPHATSKITEFEDLDNISTMGFRGEALASITAVAMVEMKTRTHTQPVGTRINLRGGVVEEFSECSCSCGTSIYVENLFFNTPARLKFLRKPKTEEADIISTMEKLALAYSYVAIKFLVDGKVQFQTFGKGLEDAVSNILSLSIFSNIFKFKHSRDNYRVSGYLGKRTFAKPNKNYQTIIINDRVISNVMISQAVTQAYGECLMKGSHPVFILDIVMPFDELDVNVHPNKKDVRFKQPNAIYSLIYSAVRQGLDASGGSVGEIFPQNSNAFKYNENNLSLNKTFYNSSANSNDALQLLQNTINCNENVRNSTQFGDNVDTVVASAVSDGCAINRQPLDNLYNLIKDDSGKSANFSDSSSTALSKAISGAAKSESHTQDLKQLSINDKNMFVVIGQVFGTYLLIEKDSNLYIFDQHACQERLFYDKLCNEINKKMIVIQKIAVPYIVNLTYLDNLIFLDCLPFLNDIGFDIEEFGNYSYKINAIPLTLAQIDIEKLLGLISMQSKRLSTITFAEIFKDELAKLACKSAIKGNYTLNNQQIELLFKSFLEGDEIPLQCPHGRPAVFKMAKKSFEKIFKRLV